MEIEDGTAIGAKHYQLTGAQPIEIMQNVMTAEEFVGFFARQHYQVQLADGAQGE